MRTEKCLACNTSFVVPVMNLYKVKLSGKIYHACSYTCYRRMLAMDSVPNQGDKDNEKSN